MKKLISERLAANSMLFILSAIVVFHFLIMAGIIPFEFVWGGQLKNQTEMLQFESVSIALNLLILALTAIKTGLLKINLKPTFLKVSFWLMTVLFTLNTFGNLLAVHTIETLIFTPLTFILAVFSFRLAISKDQRTGLEINQQ